MPIKVIKNSVFVLTNFQHIYNQSDVIDPEMCYTCDTEQPGIIVHTIPMD